MNSVYFEKELLNYFSEVIYVDSNPAILKTERKFKENGKLKIEKSQNKIHLKSLLLYEGSKNLMSPECGCSGIIDNIKQLPPIKFRYSSNFIEKIFINKEKKLVKFLLEIVKDDNYLITNSKISKIIKKYLPKITIYQIDSVDEYFQDRLENKIIIGKKIPIYLQKEFNKIKDFESFEVFYFCDLNKFTVVSLI